MQQLEVLSIDWVFVALAQETQVVDALQILKLGWIPSKLLEIGADSAGILHATMNQFLLPVATNLKGDGGDNRGHRHDEQRYYQKKCEQNITALPRTGTDVAGSVSDATSSGGSLELRCFPQNHTYPWVRGIFCGGPLPSTSWISTEFADMRMTL